MYQRPRIDARQVGDPISGLQLGVKLIASDIHREHPGRATRQQHLGEAAGRRADVQADVALDVDRILLERARELSRLPPRAFATSKDSLRRPTIDEITAALDEDVDRILQAGPPR